MDARSGWLWVDVVGIGARIGPRAAPATRPCPKTIAPAVSGAQAMERGAGSRRFCYASEPSRSGGQAPDTTRRLASW